jgi:hypothetical protein
VPARGNNVELPKDAQGKVVRLESHAGVPAARGLATLANDSWKTRTTRLVGQMHNPKAKEDIAPFLREGEEWLIAAATQVAEKAGGEVGPIEMNALAAAAWQTAYARYWLHLATVDPTNLKLVEVASRLQDAAAKNSLQAYNLAVQLAKTRKAEEDDDPLKKFDIQTPAEPAQGESNP